MPIPGKEMILTPLDSPLYKGSIAVTTQDDGENGTLMKVLLYVEKGTTAKFTPTSSNTLLVGAVGPPVVWSKPDDFEFDPTGPAPNLFTAPFNGLLAALADGSVS